MLRRNIFARCAAAATTSSASATTASATSTNDTTSTMKKRKIYIDKRKEMYGLRILMFVIFTSIYIATRYVSARVHTEHQFIPVYNEDGDLEGFTHPALVEAADKVREKSSSSGSNAMKSW